MFSGAMAIVLAAAGAGAVHSGLTPVSMRLENTATGGSAATTGPATAPAPATTPATQLDPDTLGAHIDLAQAKALFDQGLSFVDAREEHERGEGWISGSVHLTAAMMSEVPLPDSFTQLEREAPIVIYCAGGTCDASENLAILLKQAGFKKLHVFTDGFPAWKGAGYPIEGGSGTSGAGGGH